MQKTIYICDGCGKEYRGEKPPLRLTINRGDAILSLFVDGKRIEAMSCSGDLHFCGLGCLKAHFGDLIQALMGTGYLDTAETGVVEAEHIGSFLNWLLDVKGIKMYQTVNTIQREPNDLKIEEIQSLILEYLGIDMVEE